MKVKINSKKINQLITGEKIKIDQRKEEKESKESKDSKIDDEVKSSLIEPIPFVQELKLKLSKGKINEVFEELRNYPLPLELSNQVSLLNSKYSLLKKDQNLDAIKFEDSNIQISRILNGLLQIIDQI